jgi:hypothetical protein
MANYPIRSKKTSSNVNQSDKVLIFVKSEDQNKLIKAAKNQEHGNQHWK